MNIRTLFSTDWINKLNKLSEAKLEHAIQLKKIEITNYESACKNYPEARKIYAVAYLKRLNEELGMIQTILNMKNGFSDFRRLK